jgi:hypothetical protein
MMQKSMLAGTFIFSGMLILLVIGAFLSLFLPIMDIPFPMLRDVSICSIGIIFGGAVSLRSLGKGSLASFSIAVGCVYLLSFIAMSALGGVDVGMMMLVFGAIFSVVWLITACGVWTARWVIFRWGLKAGKICTWGSFTGVVITVLGLYIYNVGSVMVSGIRSVALTDAALQCNADELVATKVVPELHAPISGDTNLIWCAPFQLAWNEMVDVVGEGLRFGDDEPECVPWLNQQLMDKSHLDSETYFVAAGAYTPDFIRELNSEIKAQFGSGVFKPEALPKPDETEQLAAFGYLSVNLPFEHAFQRDDHPLVFKGVPVEAFTLPFGEGSEIREERAKRQVSVCYPPEEGEFIVKLKTRKTDHQLVLAKVAPDATLAETVAKVVGYVDSLPQEYLETNQQLIVPLINFDITREYNELIGHALAVENPAYRGWQIGKAGQNIRFQLDERGAVLRSSSYMMCVMCAPKQHCIFDEPFLLMLRYKGSAQPYFAMWVDNAEILVKAASE